MLWLSTAILALALVGNGAPGETVLLDFYADWCLPCRQMDPAVQELIARGYPVRRINVEREPAMASQFRADRVPCFVMLVDGREVDRVVGGTTYSRLERMCKLGLAAAANPPPPPTPEAGGWRQEADGGTQHAEPALGRPDGPDLPLPPPPASLPSPASSLTSPTAGAPVAAIDRLIAATVRLRIEDPDGHSCGSGTIIDARDGEALILTCGHIFRDSKGKGRIEVDLFGPLAGQRVFGTLLDYDLERDVALVTIRVPGPVTAVPVAPPGCRIALNDPVVTLGCNNGAAPTACRSRITAIDKFLGPPNLEVAGMPVQGRSGGGLFSGEGLLIGVCNAADPDDNEGLFTALAAIHSALDEAKLDFVYRARAGTPAADAPLVALAPPPMPKQMPPPAALVPVETGDRRLDTGGAYLQPPASSLQPLSVAAGESHSALSGEEQAALEEIRRRRQQGAEVVMVIRSRTDPQAPSEVIVLDNVSPEFLDRLAADSRMSDRSDGRQLTSLEISRPAQGFPRPPAELPGARTSPSVLLEYPSAGTGNPAASNANPMQVYAGGMPRR